MRAAHHQRLLHLGGAVALPPQPRRDQGNYQMISFSIRTNDPDD